ncbi:MAG TPA: hypothetical protein VMT88_00490 [Actinomycetes bacterium]|nr:hypothetical protein [Actinomycetes bacterium]
MRTWLVKAPVIITVLLLAIAGGRWLNDNQHQVAYYAYLDRYVVGSWSHGPEEKQQAREWLDSHHDLFLVEGRAACKWLEQFPEVPEIVPDGSADSSALASRFVEETADSSQMNIPKRHRVMVDRAAWAELCPGTGDSRTSLAFDPDADLGGGPD